VQELGALMLKAGKAAEAAKHLQQALDIKVVHHTAICECMASWMFNM
jgi:hypothetical protein